MFVSPPGGSAFMHELLESVADAVRRTGGFATTHIGGVEDVAAGAFDVDPGSVVTVVVPHEYFAIHGEPDPQRLRRTIGFGVEHPGTLTFDTSTRLMAALGACVEIAADAVTVVRRKGIAAERFRLGCSPRTGAPPAFAAREVDVVHLGTADETRLRKLAGCVDQLAGLRTELLLPPHEPMTRDRPDFLTGSAKRDLLERSKLLLNIHREGSPAFEWVRALDAISAGCVVLTEPSRGMAPLVPGEHLLVAPVGRIGTLARAALTDPDALSAIAAAAYEVCTTELDIVASAARLVDIAADLLARTPGPAEAALLPTGVAPPPRRAGPAPMATWVPCERLLPLRDGEADAELAGVLRAAARLRHANARPSVRRSSTDVRSDVDVVCVHAAGDGPLGLTTGSLRSGPPVALHVADAVRESGAISGEADSGYAASVVAFEETVTRGFARNELLTLGAAEFVLVLDSGDELYAGVLERLVGELRRHPELRVVYPMAVTSRPMIVNALIPEPRRLADWPYLGRGYLARRDWLDRLGGFDDSIEADGFTDHDFWLRTAHAGVPTRLLRQVGIRLWPQPAPTGLAAQAPGAVRSHLDARAADVPSLVGA